MAATDPNDTADGSSHGQASPLRWDHSIALALIVLGALALLGLIHVQFSPRLQASASVGR